MDIGLGHAGITLESRFADLDQPVLLTGIQALLRLLLEQRRLDMAAGLNTAALVSGYRGSPLGGLDRELWAQKKLMAAHDIRFEPGVNEDLAATMLYGTQELDAFPGARVDGVYGMWYGKGPGVDRTGDAFHCANMGGTHKHGGILAIAGDDHGAHSSTYPHQTEYVFQNCFIPVLNPASVQDVIDLGLAGWAMSRFAGVWVAMKTTAETMEQASTAVVPSVRRFVTPDIALPPHGLNYDPTLHFPADRAELERRMIEERMPAVLAWARANRIDRLISGSADATIGLVTVGKAHEDTMHALRRLGLDRHPQIAIYKVGMTWPLETEGLREFARGKRSMLVIEEKRGFVESQIRDALYHLPADERPEVSGKTDPRGAPLLSPLMELSPESVAGGLTTFLGQAGLNLPALPAPVAADRPDGLLRRIPAFCAGCPHATSTKLPDGSFASAGIGCHFMAMDDGPGTRTFTHMGGEGAPFVGLSSFTEMKHMFANLGDGTYQHSGSLAIRQAVAAKTRITYKLLFNDAVAMTGGQPAEGGPTVPHIAAQLAAEGVQRIAIVADEADRLPPASALPPGVTRHTRDELDAVQTRVARLRGAVGADLRSGLRHGEAPAAQARLDGAADAACRDQRSGVRELRRLFGAIRLYRDRAGGNRARAEAADQSDKLQCRSVVPEGVLPEFRDPGGAAGGARCGYAVAGAGGGTGRRRCRCRWCRRWGFGVGCSPGSAAAGSLRPARSWRWRRIWKAGR